MWYYTQDGQQAGPVDDAALDQLIASGMVTAATYLWKEGQADWLPLAQARPVQTVANPAAAPLTGACDKCGKNVGADNLVDLLGVRICAECKPLVLQSIQEGAPVSALGGDTAWVEGKQVVTKDKFVLPHRCFKCNQPADGAPIKRKFYWHPSAYYLLILVGIFLRIGILIYVIVAIIVRKRATVEIHLCAKHKQRRRTFLIAGGSGILLAFGLLIGGALISTTWVIGLGGLAGLVIIICRIAMGNLARPKRIDGETVWLSGAGKEFLASLPQWPLSKK